MAKPYPIPWEYGIGLEGFLEDGRYGIDNNWVENRIRPVALGRKNYVLDSVKAKQNLQVSI